MSLHGVNAYPASSRFTEAAHAARELRVRSVELCERRDAAPPGFEGLLAGAWKIVDRFESGGQRYVVAEVDGSSRPLCPLAVRALSLAMGGHANKVIAIELGASQPTVTRLLSRALRSLRVSGMREAIALAHTEPVWLLEGRRDVFSWCLKRSSWCDDAALSAAERDVVQRIADGASRADIARARGTSLHTVHSQIASAFAKLGVGSKRELMQRASCVPMATGEARAPQVLQAIGR